MESVNTGVSGELEAAIGDQLRRLGFIVQRTRALTEPRADLCARWPDGKRDFMVELLSRVPPSSAGIRWPDKHVKPSGRRVLGVPHVTPGAAERLRARGVPFVDSGGNAWISEPGLHIWVEGRRPSVAERPGGQRVTRPFRPTGLRVLFVVLAAPHLLDAPLREIAIAAGVSLGAVSNTLRGLEEAGHLGSARKRRVLRDPARLSSTWMEHYVSTLRPTLAERRVAGPAARWWASEEAESAVLEAGMQFGGESVLARRTTRYRAEETVLFGKPPWSPLIRRLRMPMDDDGRVVLRERFWEPHLVGDAPEVPPLLVHAEALASRDERQIEIADMIFGKGQDSGVAR